MAVDSELLVVVLLGLWVLNWLAVVAMTAALGLRRRRWGTPGGGRAMLSAGLALLAPLIGGTLVGAIWWFELGPGDVVEEVLFPATLAAVLTAVVGSHACLVRAVVAVFRAADAVAPIAERP